ncbi:Uncharacterized protein DAT39_013971 [Clarias magur]|uniref:Uncharacterized protein n=1 Tax=Clarias magur TaxID=1594786 RepID=A0A8J4TJ17_CLAMG|nr:Uncharacterized protein DAT39_013971 [Clarias magur]
MSLPVCFAHTIVRRKLRDTRGRVTSTANETCIYTNTRFTDHMPAGDDKENARGYLMLLFSEHEGKG